MLTRFNDWASGIMRALGMGRMPKALREEAGAEGLRIFDTREEIVIVGGRTREVGFVRFPHRWLD